MSKLYSIYLSSKKQNPNSIFLFKSGIFFIALENDAITLSNLFNLKLTNLNAQVQKCGFPCSSFEKYSHLFKALNLNIKIIEINQNISYSISEYTQDKNISELLEEITNINEDSLSVAQAYECIKSLKLKVSKILGKV